MDRFTISLNESLASQFDRLIAENLMAERGVRHGALTWLRSNPSMPTRTARREAGTNTIAPCVDLAQ